MSIPRLHRVFLLLAVMALPIATGTAQRGSKPTSDSPRPAAQPRPAATPAPRPTPAAPRPMPAAPRPTADAPRPQAAPRPTPAAPPRSFPRPTPAAPAPTRPSQPAPQPSRPYSPPRPRDTSTQPGSRPGYQPSNPQPSRPTPRPRDDGGGIRTPGENRPTPRPTYPRPIPSDTPRPAGQPPRAVGGSVRIHDRPAPSSSSGTPSSGASSSGTSGRAPTRGNDVPNLKPRDLYDDTLARPKPPTPSGTATPKPGQPRPTTTSQLADRYHTTPRPRGDGPQVKPADSSIHVGGRPSTGPGRPRPTLVTDRYTTQPTPAGPRDTTLPGGARPSGVRPTLTPRPATGTRGVTTLVAGVAPHLVARPRTTTSVLSSPHRSNFGSCFGPVWDPCWSWSNQWSNHCSPTLTWSLGIGSGSFCWGWSSWFGSHCHRRYSSPFYGYYGSYGYSSAWWDPCWYRPYSSPCWWWPRSYYAPSYLYVQPAPSTVVVYDDSTPAVTETIVVGGDSSRSMTPEERGRRYLALGDFYFREGRFREAADTYAKARTLLPDDATIHFVLADAVFALGDYHFAAFLIGEGLRLDPNLADADTDKRLLYGDPKVFETQMQTLVRYLDEKSYDAMAHLVLGYNLKFSDNRKDAEKAFRRVLEIDPESHAARLLLESLTAPAPKAGDAPAAAPVEPAKSDR